MSKDGRTQQILAIVYREIENKIEYLLFKRIEKKGGFWQPISGGVEPFGEDPKSRETVKDAVYRELDEEASIKKDDIIKLDENVYYFAMFRHYLTSEPINPLTEFVYGVKVMPNIKINIGNNVSQEHEKYEWFNYDEAINKLKWEDNKNALTELNNILIKK